MAKTERIQNLTLVAGQAMAPITLELDAQQTPIKGVVIDAGNCSADIWVYQGRSATGTPFIVKAGWARGFTLEGTSAVYITFASTPGNGSLYICVSSESQTAFSTQEVTLGSPLPQGASPFTATVESNLGVIGSSAILLFSFPGMVIAKLYLSSFGASGMDKQKHVLWELGFGPLASTVPVVYGYGDFQQTWNPPLVFTFIGSSSGLYFGAAFASEQVGPFVVAATIGGYIL